jgi:hypothetical protein
MKVVSQRPPSNVESIISTRFTGFPAADHEVRDFLKRGTSPSDVYAQYSAFFIALFQQLLARFQNIDVAFEAVNKKRKKTADMPTAAKFHFLMTYNQVYGASNEYRRKFYQDVCATAESVSNGICTLIWYLCCIRCSWLFRIGNRTTNRRMSP